MRIKHVAALALLTVIIQTPPAEANGRKEQRGIGVEQLGLSEEQQAQLEAIRTAFDARAQTLRETHKSDELAVLSEEQLATLTAYRSEENGRAGHRIDLGLSEEQMAAIRDLGAAYKEARTALQQARREAVAALLTDEQLTALAALRNPPSMRGQRISLAERLGLSAEQQTELTALRTNYAERAQALHEAHRADKRSVLTEEQLAALIAYHSEGHRRGDKHLNLGLSDDQISSINDLDATYRQARTSLYAAHQEAVAALLTEEQLALLEALHSAPPFRGIHRGRHGYGNRVEANRGGGANESIDGLADPGTGEGQTGESSLLWSGASELTTAVENTRWGRIKNDLLRK